LIKAFGIRFQPETTMDRYEESLLTYIEDKKRVVEGGHVKHSKRKSSPVSYDTDFFSQLDDL